MFTATQKYFVFYVVCSLLLNTIPIEAARGGGGGGRGGGGGGGGRVSSSSSRTSYGSSSPSSSSSFARQPSSSSAGSGRVSAPAAGSSATRYGSSAPSGSSGNYGSASRGVGGSAGNARPNYGVAGNSASRSSVNRPTANAPVPSRSTPVQPNYNTKSTTINNFGGSAFGSGGGFGRSGFGTGSLLLAGAGGAIGGYMLGSMLASSMYRHNSCCYGCGCGYMGAPPPWYYDSYVPYRYRYGTTTTNNVVNNTTNIVNNVVNGNADRSTNIRALDPNKKAELCDLARWNMELPFSEMPNMVLTFLSSNNISGTSVQEKAQFLNTFFNQTASSYGMMNSTNNVFTIPSGSDLSVCNFNIPRPGGDSNAAVFLNETTTAQPRSAGGPRQWYEGAVMDSWRQTVRSGDRSPCTIASFAKIPECESSSPRNNLTEEPFITAVKQITKLYSNQNTDPQMITDVVDAAKRCYPIDGGVVPPKETQKCLDFSISSDQVMALETPGSIFGNKEVCRKMLNPDLLTCSPAGSTFPCTLTDLVNLNVFARNYYLCEEPVDAAMIAKLQERYTGTTLSPTIQVLDRKSLGLETNQVITSQQFQNTGLNVVTTWYSVGVMLLFLLNMRLA